MLRVERTFLINKLPTDYNTTRFSKIRQCYLIDSPDACRIRERDGVYTITHKLFTRPGDFSHREYADFPIVKQEFEILWQAAKSRLEKNRYYYKATVGYQLRIDEFLGPLAGFFLAEMIFPWDQNQEGLQELDWLGREITNEPWAYNQFISTQTYDSIMKIVGPFQSNVGQPEVQATS